MSDIHRVERLATASLSDEECPAAEELAAFVLAMLDGPAQLRVAAHVRGCPLCQELALICAPPPAPARRPLLARLADLSPAAELRGDADPAQPRRYVAADITIELTIPRPEGEMWQIVGQVLRGGLGLPLCPVQLQAGRRRPITRICDVDGFFSFEGLPAGAYRMTVEHAQVRVEIASLSLGYDG